MKRGRFSSGGCCSKDELGNVYKTASLSLARGCETNVCELLPGCWTPHSMPSHCGLRSSTCPTLIEPLLWVLPLPLIQMPPLSIEASNELKSPCVRRLDRIRLSQGTYPMSGIPVACVHVASTPFFFPLVLWWKGNGHSFESWLFFFFYFRTI